MSAVSPERRLLATGSVRRRKRKSRMVEVVAVLSSGLAVAVLALVVLTVLFKALPALNLDLFTKTEATFARVAGASPTPSSARCCSSASPLRWRCRSAC